jgi:hypothetical protein
VASVVAPFLRDRDSAAAGLRRDGVPVSAAPVNAIREVVEKVWRAQVAIVQPGTPPPVLDTPTWG